MAEAPFHRGGKPKVGRFVFLVPAVAERLCRGAGLVPELIDEQINGRDFMVVYRRPE